MKKIHIFLLLSLLIFTSCKKDETPPPPKPSTIPIGHYIGEVFGGGIIFYLDTVNGLETGLIVSKEEIRNSVAVGGRPKWSNVDSVLVGVDNVERDTNGMENTLKIIAQQNHENSAARACREYRGGEYNDWYLPSYAECKKLHDVRKIVNKRMRDEKFGFGIFSEIYTSNEKYRDRYDSLHPDKMAEYGKIVIVAKYFDDDGSWAKNTEGAYNYVEKHMNNTNLTYAIRKF